MNAFVTLVERMPNVLITMAAIRLVNLNAIISNINYPTQYSSSQCTCRAGLTGDPFVACSDTDECAAQTNPCGGNWNNLILFELLAHIDEYLAANAVCRNTNPGYKCECPPGFTGNGNIACEATEVRTLCKTNFDCTNNAECQAGQCVCRQGFTAAGTLCLDVDECRSDPQVCGANAVCVNTPGSFSCSCLPSFVGSPPSSPCSEPCVGVKCSQHAFCKAQDKEAYCECEPGWTYDPTNIAAGCVDVNECGQPGTCGDNSICTNLPGSHLCQCKPGYTGNPQVRNVFILLLNYYIFVLLTIRLDPIIHDTLL